MLMIFNEDKAIVDCGSTPNPIGISLRLSGFARESGTPFTSQAALFNEFFPGIPPE
jgi:hypothetical protein